MDWVNRPSTSSRIKDAIDNSVKSHDKEILQFLKIAYKCVVSRPKDKWSTYQIYQSLKNISKDRSLSENYNEFPLLFGQPKNDSI